tara:strand:+ start:1689 stop:2201 length:513 start_codon:yes stop_codon:yes gene_type:complete
MSTINSLTNNHNVRNLVNHHLGSYLEQLQEEGYSIPALTVSFKDPSRKQFNTSEKYVKFFEDYLDKIKSSYGLSLTEQGIITTLIKYIGFEDNLLRHPNSIPIKRKDMEDILGLAHNAVDKHLDNLVKKGILAKNKVKRSTHFYLNPYVAYKGKYIDKTLLDMFSSTHLV